LHFLLLIYGLKQHERITIIEIFGLFIFLLLSNGRFKHQDFRAVLSSYIQVAAKPIEPGQASYNPGMDTGSCPVISEKPKSALATAFSEGSKMLYVHT